MHLIVGLGNPGKEYARTRHNAAWIILDNLLEGYWEEDKFAHAQTQEKDFADTRVVFVKPQTFMNNSGKSVKFLVDRHNLSSERVIVLYDDVALPLGTFKISYDRSDGGHNGVASVIEQLRTQRFIRIRIGVGPTTLIAKIQKKTKKLSDFVLSHFSKGELEDIEKLTPTLKEVLEVLIKQGRDEAMNRFN